MSGSYGSNKLDRLAVSATALDDDGEEPEDGRQAIKAAGDREQAWLSVAGNLSSSTTTAVELGSPCAGSMPLSGRRYGYCGRWMLPVSRVSKLSFHNLVLR